MEKSDGMLPSRLTTLGSGCSGDPFFSFGDNSGLFGKSMFDANTLVVATGDTEYHLSREQQDTILTFLKKTQPIGPSTTVISEKSDKSPFLDSSIWSTAGDALVEKQSRKVRSPVQIPKPPPPRPVQIPQRLPRVPALNKHFPHPKPVPTQLRASYPRFMKPLPPHSHSAARVPPRAGRRVPTLWNEHMATRPGTMPPTGEYMSPANLLRCPVHNTVRRVRVPRVVRRRSPPLSAPRPSRPLQVERSKREMSRSMPSSPSSNFIQKKVDRANENPPTRPRPNTPICSHTASQLRSTRRKIRKKKRKRKKKKYRKSTRMNTVTLQDRVCPRLGVKGG
eukprot:644670_1